MAAYGEILMAAVKYRNHVEAGLSTEDPSDLLFARTREANRPPVTNGTSQDAQLVAQCLRSYRTDAQGLSRRGAGSPYTPTTPPPAVKVGPSARSCGAPLTAITGVVRLGHARTPPQKAQLCEPERPPHP
jgi:hypothetical protein